MIQNNKNTVFYKEYENSKIKIYENKDSNTVSVNIKKQGNYSKESKILKNVPGNKTLNRKIQNFIETGDSISILPRNEVYASDKKAAVFELLGKEIDLINSGSFDIDNLRPDIEAGTATIAAIGEYRKMKGVTIKSFFTNGGDFNIQKNIMESMAFWAIIEKEHTFINHADFDQRIVRHLRELVPKTKQFQMELNSLCTEAVVCSSRLFFSCANTLEEKTLNTKKYDYKTNEVKIIIDIKKKISSELKDLILESLDGKEDFKEEAYNTIKGFIKIQKYSSFERFIMLPSNLKHFLKIISIIPNNDIEKSKLSELVNDLLKLDTVLLEHSLHRKTQGAHCRKYDKLDKQECNLKKTENKKIFKSIFNNSRIFNFSELEAAHILPFPAQFSLQELLESKDKQIAGTKCIREDFMLLSRKDRLKQLKKDFDLFKKELGNKDVDAYVRSCITTAFKILTVDFSKTIHMPSFFNQVVDGISEQKITSDDPKILKKQKKNKKINDKFIEELLRNDSAANIRVYEYKKPVFSEKTYKYILAKNLRKMIKSEYPLRFKEVLEFEKSYYDGIKNSLIDSIRELPKDKPSVGELIYAQSLINVYLAIKNAEAKGKVNWTDEKDMAICESLCDWRVAVFE